MFTGIFYSLLPAAYAGTKQFEQKSLSFWKEFYRTHFVCLPSKVWLPLFSFSQKGITPLKANESEAVQRTNTMPEFNRNRGRAFACIPSTAQRLGACNSRSWKMITKNKNNASLLKGFDWKIHMLYLHCSQLISLLYFPPQRRLNLMRWYGTHHTGAIH